MSTIQDLLQRLTSEDNIKTMVKDIKRRVKAKQRLAKAKKPIEYSEWNLAGQSYWIGSDKSVYDIETEEYIGKYDFETKEFTIDA